MPGKAPPTTVTVDDDVVARARERLDADLDARVEAEVKRLVQKDHPTMDPQIQAALDAAQKTAKDALDAATQAKTDAAATKAAVDASTKTLAGIETLLKEQAKAGQDAANERVAAKALKAAKARAILAGQDARKVDDKHPDFVRLAKLPEPALDELLSLAMPGNVAAGLQQINDPKPEQPADGLRENDDGSLTVADWSKVPKPFDRKAAPMGVPA